MRNLFYLFSAGLMIAQLSSCGYHFTPVGGVVPATSKTIAIPVFVNDTFEPYVDTAVTSAVAEEFMTDGRLKVVGPEDADLVLRGRVSKVLFTPQSYDVNNYIQSENVSIEVRMTLEDTRTGKVLLKDQGVGSIFTSGYSVTAGNITSTKIAKEAAIQKAAKDIASSVRSRVLEGF